MPAAGFEVADALPALVADGERVFGLGPAPRPPAGWHLDGPFMLAQMVCQHPLPEPDGPDIVPLTEAHADDLRALTALVYPKYFRPRTTVLGRYFGIYLGDRLAATIGERMATDHWQEISAVCTHPDFVGRGLARRLLIRLGNDVLAQGRTPFLHVSLGNARAIELYARNGYRTRAEIVHWGLTREAAVG